MHEAIAAQILASGVDVLLGGGRDYFDGPSPDGPGDLLTNACSDAQCPVDAPALRALGTASDARHSRIGVGTGNRHFQHISPAAKQLQTAIHHTPLQLGRDQFRRSCINRIKLALDVQLGTAIDKHTL